MEFDINSYQGSNTVMCCRSYEEVICFAEYLDSVGRRWCNGKYYTEHTIQYQLADEENGFCFVFNQGLWDREYALKEASNEEWQIIYFSDFSWDKVDSDNTIHFEESSEIDEFLNQYIS